MTVELFANNAQTALNGAITAGAGSLVVASATGLPAPSSTAVPPTQYRIRVEDAPAGSGVNLEFMTVTDAAGTTLQVQRGQEGTTGIAHGDGSAVTMVATAGALQALPGAVSTAGTLAQRPVAGGVSPGFLYFATDDNGGTVYRSDGATWTKITPGVLESSGAELGYAEITSNFGPTAGVANTVYAITGLSITVTVGSRPIIVDAGTEAVLPSAGTATVGWQIYEDGAFVGATSLVGSATANKRISPYAKVRRTPAAGSHTYDVRFKSDIAATLTLEAGVGFPSWIQAREV